MQDNFHETILLEGLVEGNVKIYDYLFHYYYSGLVSFAIKYVKDKDVAEDIVQEFFYKLWINKENLKITNTLKAYFFTSVKNRCLDYFRKQEVRVKAKDYFINLNENLENLVDDEQKYFVESELREHIFDVLNKLPEKCRRVFVMNRFEGLKPIEISEKEQISVRTVEGHIGKALKILRQELKTYLPDFIIVLILGGLK